MLLSNASEENEFACRCSFPRLYVPMYYTNTVYAFTRRILPGNVVKHSNWSAGAKRRLFKMVAIFNGWDFFFAFLDSWICFLSYFIWEQFSLGRQQGKMLSTQVQWRTKHTHCVTQRLHFSDGGLKGKWNVVTCTSRPWWMKSPVVRISASTLSVISRST